jgi:hypothetical protein
MFLMLPFFYGKVSGQMFDYYNELDYIKYYPLNEHNTQTDTFSTNDLSAFLNAMDTTENAIYRKLNKNDFCRIYKISGDTIKSFKYDFRKRAFSSIELFVYNSNKLIQLYIDCTDYHYNKNSISFTAIQFFYKNNELTDKLTYYQGNYSFPITEFSSFDLSNFKITSAINYKIAKTKSNTYITGQECIGPENFRSRDTLIYNSKGLLMKYNSYADNRALGCPMGLFVNDIFEYNYLKDSVTITFTQTHRQFPGVDKKCEVYAEPYIYTMKQKYTDMKFNYILCAQLRNTSKKWKNYVIK